MTPSVSGMVIALPSSIVPIVRHVQSARSTTEALACSSRRWSFGGQVVRWQL
jgi:hypothetical protein